jgi:hypothetical protein
MKKSSKRSYPVGWQMGKPQVVPEADQLEEQEEDLPARDTCIRIVINDKDMPETLFAKDESGSLVVVLAAARIMYRIAGSIAAKLKFLPMPKVKIKIVRYGLYSVKDYSGLLDVCLRILYRAGVIEDTSGSTVKGVEIECIKSDRCKVVLLVEPVKANVEAKELASSDPLHDQPLQ